MDSIASIFVKLQPAHEKIGVVDAQWIVHKTLPTLGNQVKENPSSLNLNQYLLL